MDIRKVFKEISVTLGAAFRKSAQVSHHGGKGALREDAIRKFLAEHLPGKYTIGQGEIISSENRVSGQLDVVIYDANICPALIVSADHSVFPVECVYGAISLKSHLDSAELADAYQNIASAKRIMPRGSFTHQSGPGHFVGLNHPTIVSGIVAYDAHRSMDAIRDQLLTLDEGTPDEYLRPDFVAVIDKGIILTDEPIRDQWNAASFSEDSDKRRKLRKTGTHTLLKLYMHILRELNTITLGPFDLADYEKMPSIVGEYRVRKHNHFVRYKDGKPDDKVYSLSASIIKKIAEESADITVRDSFLRRFEFMPMGDFDEDYLNQIVRIWNPRNLVPLGNHEVPIVNGRAVFPPEVFNPIVIEINDIDHLIDFSVLEPDDFVVNEDTTVNELFAD